MVGMLRALEPFALDLSRHEVFEEFPGRARFAEFARACFRSLYQLLTVTV